MPRRTRADDQEDFAIPGRAQHRQRRLAASPSSAFRSGPLSTRHYLYTLAGLARLAARPRARRRRARTTARDHLEHAPAGTWRLRRCGHRRTARETAWQWVRRLLDAGRAARAFTVTPERYSPARTAEDLAFCDYDGDGTTIRFGDGTFGRAPAPGTTFRVRYLAGGGAAGNVGRRHDRGRRPGRTAIAWSGAARTRSLPPAARTRKQRPRSATAPRSNSVPGCSA